MTPPDSNGEKSDARARKSMTLAELLLGTDTPDPLDRAMDLCASGHDADELPNASGEFGWSLGNPIPTCTIPGSQLYLYLLRDSSGRALRFERIGSFSSPTSDMPVDGYTVRDSGGRTLGTLYLSPYQKRISRKAPRGLVLTPLAG